jgi:K+-sensing histidine kinase KdpD
MTLRGRFSLEESAKAHAAFARADQARVSTGNVGLGLTIVDKFAVPHGGCLDYRNLPQGGFEALLRLLMSPVSPQAGRG